MVGTCITLALAHKRHRKQKNAEIREYYHEQLGFVKLFRGLQILKQSTDIVDQSSHFTRLQAEAEVHLFTASQHLIRQFSERAVRQPMYIDSWVSDYNIADQNTR